MDLEPYLPCCLFCIGVAEKPQTHHLFKKHLLLCPLCIVHSWILGKRRKINQISQIRELTFQCQDIQVTTIYSAKGSKNLMVPCVLSMKKVTCLYKACSLCLQLIVCNLAWQEKWEIIPNTHKLCASPNLKYKSLWQKSRWRKANLSGSPHHCWHIQFLLTSRMHKNVRHNKLHCFEVEKSEDWFRCAQEKYAKIALAGHGSGFLGQRDDSDIAHVHWRS